KKAGVRLCSLPRLSPWLASHDATDRSFKSGGASASGAFFSCVRLSAMILVECKAAVVKVEYWTISRCTCAPLLCSMCLKVCNSVMSLSISCTEVVVARFSKELMLLATISLSFSGWRSRLVTTSRRTTSRICASTAGWSCSAVSRVLRNAMFDPPFGAPRGRKSTSETPGEHEKVTAWRPDRANSWVEFCLRCALLRPWKHEVPKAEAGRARHDGKESQGRASGGPPLFRGR